MPAPMSDPTPRNLWLIRLLAVGTSLTVTFVFAEIALRILGISYPILYEAHPVSGGAMRPFAKGWYHLEGHGFLEANDIGFRDVVHPREKPAGDYRIAFLGDSYTEAQQMAQEETFRAQVVDKLSACPALAGRRPVGLNFAISGHGTAQQYEILRQIAWDYDPDFVLLTFVGNDLPNNHPAFGGRGDKPFYVFDEAGNLMLDDSFKTSPGFTSRNAPSTRFIRTLSDYSRVVQLVLEARRVIRRVEIETAQGTEEGQFNQSPVEPKVAEAWKLTEAILDMLVREVRGRGREILVSAASSPHAVNPDADARRTYLESAGMTRFDYQNKRIGAVATRAGAHFIDLNPPFADYAQANDTCLHGFENMLACGGHWNQAGHRLAAELMAKATCLAITESSR